jgi:hypothetical protein
MDTIKIAAFVINIFLPGVGTLLVGKIGVGIAQILLYAIAHALTWTVIGALIGLPLIAIVWIWALISVATAPPRPPAAAPTARSSS